MSNEMMKREMQEAVQAGERALQSLYAARDKLVKSNRLMSTGVIGFLLLMAVMAVIDGGISMMPLILATCAVGTAAVFFWQAGSYRVDIYENGLEIFGGVLTRAGVYLYKKLSSAENGSSSKSI